MRFRFAPCRLLAGLIPWLAFLPVALAQDPTPFRSGAWCGNVTSTSATVCIRLTASGQLVRLVLSRREDLSAPEYSQVRESMEAAGNAVSLDVSGLQANTVYYYGIEVAGTLRSEALARGRFRTFPPGAASFKLALIGDGDYRLPFEDQVAYRAVAAEDPLLLIFNGDIHYDDNVSANPEAYRLSYDHVLEEPSQGGLFRQVPIAYVWDDHDAAGGDNSNGTAVGAAAARGVYADYVPHYPLRAGDGTIGQAFTVGRVRIIMTDLRSAASNSLEPESPGKSRMGVAQKAWFKQELLVARDAGFPLVLWVCATPWIAPELLGADSWGGYATERREIADFLKANRIRNLVAYCGDMHAIAYDDGTNSDYATDKGAPVIVLHSTPLTQEPNVKGGPYSAGPILGTGQYGILEVTDNGGPTIQCRFRGMRVGEGAKLVYQFTASSAAIESRGLPLIEVPAERVLVNIAARGRIGSPSDPLIAGFVVGGRSPRNILLRAVGPSLTSLGVADAVAQPILKLYQGSRLIASNEGWGLLDAPKLVEVFDRVGAFRLAGTNSRDAALLLTVEPGPYTVQAEGANGGVGAVLLEVYEVP